MFSTLVKDEEYSVKFEYQYSLGNPSSIQCTLLVGPSGSKDEDKALVSSSLSEPRGKDTFNRADGRRAALKKVLRQAKLSKAERTLIWAGYHQKRGGVYGTRKPEKLRRDALLARYIAERDMVQKA